MAQDNPYLLLYSLLSVSDHVLQGNKIICKLEKKRVWNENPFIKKSGALLTLYTPAIRMQTWKSSIYKTYSA